jgi:hypothetical protein
VCVCVCVCVCVYVCVYVSSTSKCSYSFISMIYYICTFMCKFTFMPIVHMSSTSKVLIMYLRVFVHVCMCICIYCNMCVRAEIDAHRIRDMCVCLNKRVERM